MKNVKMKTCKCSQEKTIDKLNKCIDCLMKLAPLI